MADVLKLWKSDSEGPYIDMVVGQKKDISIDLTDYVPAGEVLANAAWSAPAGVTFSAGGNTGLVAKKYILADAAGEHACSCLLTVVSGLYIEPVAFRVIVK